MDDLIVSLTKRLAEIAEVRLAEVLGRPVRRCPACGEVGAHWVPSRLDGAGLVLPGRFMCAMRGDMG